MREKIGEEENGRRRRARRTTSWEKPYVKLYNIHKG
jgi:hypothetical protein